ncbi:HNH endonuclease [Promicromonospora sp. MS192]|uniref:HNH endonuclease n=1 Tax=Promicromonospora sp. MS192 TaxID=3412684 RepID=UPI003C2EBB68
MTRRMTSVAEAGEALDSALPDASATVGDAAILDAGVAALLRGVIAHGVLPGGDRGGVPGETQAAWVDLLEELEKIKHTVSAAQARVVVALDEATRAAEAAQGIRAERRGRGVASQVGLAMGLSPNAAGSFVGDAGVWVRQMPYTLEALRRGALSEWRARMLVRETSHLSPEHRALIDEQICGDLRTLAGLGGKRLTARIKELAARLDVHACVKRLAKAEGERRVSVRPAPDLMVYLTALVPMKQGVQAYAQLAAHAAAARAAGDERSGGQVMADTLIERVTGRERADDVPVTVNLLVSDEALLAGGEDPAVLLEGSAAGVGVVPAPVARELVAAGVDADAAWLRAIYVNPAGRLLATTSTSRFFTRGITTVLRARQHGICATPYCDAPMRHADHVRPFGEGGSTSVDNGQGLCVRCNHAKQAPGWTQRRPDGDTSGRFAVETVTPTGHAYLSVAPEPPRPAGRAGWDGGSLSCAAPPGAILRPRRTWAAQRARPGTRRTRSPRDRS